MREVGHYIRNNSGSCTALLSWLPSFVVMYHGSFLIISLFLLQYASFTPETGEHYMTPSDFVKGYLGLLSEPDTCDDTVRRLAGCVDTTKDG